MGIKATPEELRSFLTTQVSKVEMPKEVEIRDQLPRTLVGKLSSGFGPLVLWGGTVLVATEVAGLSRFTASRIAVVVLAGAAVAGFLVLRPLRDQPVESPG